MLRVAELFAGVGGFRLGFERASVYYDFVYANQWEPSTKTQDAANVYSSHFDNLDNSDISKVNEKDIPKMDVLVGGFPCQDYSVASVNAKGIQGKKGVLFWDIIRIIREHQPEYCVFENVDRLLKSPSKTRGKDFGIMLKALTSEGYIVQWRAITSSEYGYSQRRKRVYILCSKQESNAMYKYLPISEKVDKRTFNLKDGYESGYEFLNSGECRGNVVNTWKSVATIENGLVLGDVIVDESEVSEKYYYTKEQVERMNYLRGAKKIPRESHGITYIYSEGAMSEVDSLEKPSRTMTTTEGNVSRTSHVVEVNGNGRRRKLIPKECERLNGFPDDWTAMSSDRKRYFFMGNALVIGIVERIAKGIMEENLKKLTETKETKEIEETKESGL